MGFLVENGGGAPLLIACFDMPDSKVLEIPGRLRALFRQPEFRTKGQRMGKVARITEKVAYYYTVDGEDVVEIELI